MLRKLRRGWFGIVLFALSAVAVGLPVGTLVLGLVRTGPYRGSWDWSQPLEALSEPVIWSVLGVTAVYALAIAVLSVSLALAFSLICVWAPRWLEWLTVGGMVVMLAVPKTFYALAWSFMGAGTGGLVNQILGAAGASELASSFSVQNWSGVIAVSVFKASAVCFLLLLGPVKAVIGTASLAARVAGASPIRALFEIELPLLRPAIGVTGVLALVLALQEFEIPAILGTSGDVRVFSTLIYEYLRDPRGPEYGQASTAALLLVVAMAILLTVQTRALGRGTYHTVTGKSGGETAFVMPRTLTAISATIVGAWYVVALGLPVLQMVLGSVQPFFGAISNFTWAHYETALADRVVMDAIGVTLLAAGLGGGVAALAAFVIAYYIVRRPGKPAFIARVVSWVPAALPGIVFSLALLWTFTTIPALRHLLATPFPLVVGLMISAVPFAVRSLEASIHQVSPDLEAAARVGGANRAMAAMRMTLGNIVPSFLAAWLLSAFVISGSLDVPLLLSGTSINTVSTLTFAAYQNGDVAKAAAVYCLYIAILAGLLLAGLLLKRIVSMLKKESK